MPGNSGVIDLNSDAVSGDQSSDVDGGDVSDLLIRVGVSGVSNDQGGVIGGMTDRVGDIGEGEDSGRVVDGLVKEGLDRVMGSANERSEVEEGRGKMPVIDDLEWLVLGSKGGVVNTSALCGKSLFSESNELENEVGRGSNEVNTLGVAGEENLIDVEVLADKMMDKRLENEKEEEVFQVAETSINKIFGVQVSEVGLSTVNESNTVNLVVDLNPYIDADENQKSRASISNKGKENVDCCINQVELNGNHDLVIKEQVKNVEKAKNLQQQNVKCAASDLEFEVSDLVWGKVRSHPWWPGQIFDPLDSSEKAMKYFKKDSFLIAYFGDQTFAWNEVTQLKPFRAHFSQMEKQINLEAFHHAVDCALDEVARRVVFGLTCSCVSEEVRRKIKTQTIVNAGIQKKSSRRDGGDRYLNASSFEPAELLNYMKILAQSSCDEVDRLEFVISQAQLSAFHHWKGFSQLPEFEMLGGLLEDDENLPLLEAKRHFGEAIEDVIEDFKDHEQVLPRKRKSRGQNSSSHEHKVLSGDSMHPSKKQRSLMDLMAGNCSYLKNIEKSSSDKKLKEIGTLLDDSAVTDRGRFAAPHSQKTLGVGDSFCRVANQLNGSTPMLKHEKPASSGKSQKRKVIPIECFSPEEMLSQIRLASIHPMEGYKFLTSSICFLSEFRNFVCLDHPRSLKDKQSLKEVSSSKSEKSTLEAVEASGSKYVKDSYWTDRMIQSFPEEETIVNLNETGESVRETQGEMAVVNVEPEAVSESRHQTAGQNPEKEAEKPVDHMSESGMEELSPTALILNFADLNSVPSETNLNRIFSRYGPLNESETEVLKKSIRAKVVFKRSSDAETAFSSSGKFSIFGPSLISYRLKYLPARLHKASSSSTKRRRKDATAMEGNAT